MELLGAGGVQGEMGDRIGMAPWGRNPISSNAPAPPRTTCIAPSHQSASIPLVVAIETSPKEVQFGRKSCICVFRCTYLFLKLSFRHTHASTTVPNQAVTHTALPVCKYASVCVRFTMHRIARPPNPVSGCVCVSPGASWVTDVCYPTPSELAQCDCLCQSWGGAEVVGPLPACVSLREVAVWGWWESMERGASNRPVLSRTASPGIP